MAGGSYLLLVNIDISFPLAMDVDITSDIRSSCRPQHVPQPTAKITDVRPMGRY